MKNMAGRNTVFEFFLQTHEEVMLMIIIVRRELNQVNLGRNVLPLYHDNGDDDEDDVCTVFLSTFKRTALILNCLTKVEEY